MITPFQRRVSLAFFSLPESDGFAVAGGAALIAREIVARPTRDIDLFAARTNESAVPAAADAFEKHALQQRWCVTHIHTSATFARMVVEGEGESLIVDIAIDSPPEEPPTWTELGPTLQAHDLAARKALALFGRAEARDFTDVHALARIYGKEQLLSWAAAADAGFDRPVFADMLDTLRRFADQDLPIPATEISNLRSFFASWAAELRDTDQVQSGA